MSEQLSPGKPHLLYLTTEYPHISHTFIRREILGLEELGYEIQRVAIRSGQAGIEQDDRKEAEATLHLLAIKSRLVTQAMKGLGAAGTRVIKAVFATIQLSRASDRGLLRHFAYLLEALALLAIAREGRVDHIHVHFGTNAATIAYLTRLMNGPQYSMTIHGPVEFDQPYGQSLGAKIGAARFVVAISSFCRSQLYRWAPMEKWDDIHIVGCSVGGDWFEAAHPLTEEAQGLVCVGRLDEQKGQLLLINSFADAVEAGFDEDLTLVGDGPFRAAIEACIYERGLQQRVHLVGWRNASEIQGHLLSAKALVVASFAEGLPVVIMEAMAVGRPILATRITGIPELVRDGTDGWLVTPGDQQALTEAILQLSQTSVVKLEEMGQCAKARVQERHHTELVVAKLDSLLQRYC